MRTRDKLTRYAEALKRWRKSEFRQRMEPEPPPAAFELTTPIEIEMARRIKERASEINP